MVQIVRSQWVPATEKTIIFEKPLVLQRIFLSVSVIVCNTNGYQIKLSFDDPLLSSFYTMDGFRKYFEVKGEGISQGDVWITNSSDAVLLYSAIQILH